MYLSLTELRQVVSLIEKQEGIVPKLKNKEVNIIVSPSVEAMYIKEDTIKTITHKSKTSEGKPIYQDIKYNYNDYRTLRIFG